MSRSEAGIDQSLKSHIVPARSLISFLVFDKDVRVLVNNCKAQVRW